MDEAYRLKRIYKLKCGILFKEVVRMLATQSFKSLVGQNSLKQCILIAGPNGSGKTTCAQHLLPKNFLFMNADMIAQTLTGESGRGADLKSGRILLKKLNKIQEEGKDFAIETTLATRKLASHVHRLRQWGYEIHLVFFWLPSDELAVQRVASRVAAGGHDVPESTIRRRFISGLNYLFNEYMDIVDTWRLYDNSRVADPKPIAIGKTGKLIQVYNNEIWEQIKKEWKNER